MSFALGDVSAGYGIPAGGIQTYDDWNMFVKAIQTSGYETDHAELTGTQALRPESLEPQLRKVVESEPTFKLFKALKRHPITSAVHEFNVQTDIGGSPSGVFNSETGEINQDHGEYERRIVFAKYLMTGVAISHVALSQKHLVSLKAQENQNALLRLSRAANITCYFGDSTVSPWQFDGVLAQLKTFRGGDHIRDVRGADIGQVVDVMHDCFADAISVGNFGRITHVHMDPTAQVAFDRYLDPAYRVNIDNNPYSVNLGAPVAGIRTSFGDIATVQDIWLDKNKRRGMPDYALSGRVVDGMPGTPTFTVEAVADANSRFGASEAGTYYYTVAAVSAGGVQSIPATPAAVTLAAGQSAQLTITPNADGKATGYVIFRSRQNPQAAPELREFREVEAIPKGSQGGNVTYTDDDDILPGSSIMFLLNLVPESIGWAQLLPATQFPLYPTRAAVIPWAVLLYGTLQLSIPNHHFVLRNYVAPHASWKPHG